MTTGTGYVRLYNKKVIPLEGYKDNFLDYLRTLYRDALARFYDVDAAFKSAIPVVASAQANKISIAASGGPYYGTNGIGDLIGLNAADPYHTNVYVPAGAGAVFHVGLEVATREEGLEVNPRTGDIEYSKLVESIGIVASPSGVTDNGDGTITFNVGSLFPDGATYTHTGRRVRVWLRAKGENGSGGPKTAVESVAIEECAVGAGNAIRTVGRLGQQAGVVDVDPTHYKVQLLGPTIVLGSTRDLTAATGVLFLGTVTSVAAAALITTIATAQQQVIQFSLSDMGNILRRDAHGSVKVHVKADPTDSGEDQFRVTDSGGTSRFRVTETGDVYFSGSLWALDANESITLRSNRSAADAGTDFVLNTQATRTAGLLLDLQNNGASKLRVGFDGALAFTSTGNITQGTADTGFTLKGNRAAASATAEVTVNSTATRTAGSLLDLQNNAASRFAFMFDGELRFTHTNAVISLTGSNTGLVLKGNKAAADGGTDFILNTVATRTNGLLLDIQNNGATRLKVDSAGYLTTTAGATLASDITINAAAGAVLRASGADAPVILYSNRAAASGTVDFLLKAQSARAAGTALDIQDTGGNSYLTLTWGASLGAGSFSVRGAVSHPDMAGAAVHSTWMPVGEDYGFSKLWAHKDASGVVHLAGFIYINTGSLAANDPFLVVPAGWRPPATYVPWVNVLKKPAAGGRAFASMGWDETAGKWLIHDALATNDSVYICCSWPTR